ncbi:TRAP transporter small permease [Vibrio sp. WXL103]|uniref:TRAP transporter small permease n=1 Tax=unclassified Vibrio TaxID=2614977 RepID=UPI003EC551F1
MENRFSLHLYKLINYLAIASLLCMVCFVLANVLLRYLFNSGIPWSEELSRVFFVWVVFLGIIVGCKEGSHLMVDVLVERCGPKLKKGLQTLSLVIVILVSMSVLIGGAKLAALTHNQGLPSTGLPSSVIYLAGVFAAILIIVINAGNLYSLLFKRGGKA